MIYTIRGEKNRTYLDVSVFMTDDEPRIQIVPSLGAFGIFIIDSVDKKVDRTSLLDFVAEFQKLCYLNLDIQSAIDKGAIRGTMDEIHFEVANKLRNFSKKWGFYVVID